MRTSLWNDLEVAKSLDNVIGNHLARYLDLAVEYVYIDLSSCCYTRLDQNTHYQQDMRKG